MRNDAENRSRIILQHFFMYEYITERQGLRISKSRYRAGAAHWIMEQDEYLNG